MASFSANQGCCRTGPAWNRRKHGAFYRVVANAVPVKEGGRATGHMSVRTGPSREQVQAAGELYRKSRAAEAKGWRSAVVSRSTPAGAPDDLAADDHRVGGVTGAADHLAR